MKIIRDSDDQRVDATVLTTGAFDGVHRGHQQVIQEVRRRAKERQVASAVVTFDVHPATVVRPESAPKLLTTLAQKLDLLESLEVDVVYVIEFDQDRASTTAARFVDEVFVGRLGAREVLVGADFHFGKGREGTVSNLAEHGRSLGSDKGFTVEGIDLLQSTDAATEPISSTAIRRALDGGDVRLASEMLGRPFRIQGEVVQGDQRGRTIGFPTANVVLNDEMAHPAHGVYACRYVGPDDRVHQAAVNVGVRPTFYESADAAVLEAHLLDFPADGESGDLYGQIGRVDFVQFLRSERRFNGIDELSAQLANDVEATRTVLSQI